MPVIRCCNMNCIDIFPIKQFIHIEIGFTYLTNGVIFPVKAVYLPGCFLPAVPECITDSNIDNLL